MKHQTTKARGARAVRRRRSMRLVLVSFAVFVGAAGGAQRALAAVPLINAAPTSFGSGQTVDLIGTGFDPNASVNVWFDANRDTHQGSNEQSIVAHTDASGDFSNVKLVVKGTPGKYFIRAGADPGVALTEVTIGTCWFQDCFINGQDTICILGFSPTDEIHDCKVLDTSYGDASAGYNLANSGPRFAGAAVLAAAVNDFGFPGTGCAAMTAAIIFAESLGNDVPNKLNFDPSHLGLLNIACGFPFPIELASYIGVQSLAGHGADPAIQDAQVILTLVGATVLAAGGPVSPLATLAQQLFAHAAVAGAIACGHVNYFCNGLDITFNILLKNTLQAKLVPLPIPGVFGKRWGDIIGWAKPVCHSNAIPPKKADNSGYEKGVCEQTGNEAMVPVPGSAGPNNVDATPECATGKVVGMSIGYDGDISFDINDGAPYDPGAINPASGLAYPPGTIDPLKPGPNVAPFTNYHNFLPGPGGSDAPGGIDVEIPRFDMALFLPQIIAMRKGLTVRVCGRYVADMHQSWNEFHPVTSVVILAADKTPPAVVPKPVGTIGQNDWYTSDVTVSWDFSDSNPAVTSSSGCDPTTITIDTAGQTLTCSATSPGGTTTQSITIKRDATPPVIGHGLSPPLDGTNGWYISAPTVTFTCSDTGGSGLESCLANGDSSGSATLGEDAHAQTVMGTATDNAGNVTQDPVSLLVDLSDPTITGATDRAANADSWFNGPVQVDFSCADAISGIAFCPPASTLGEGADQSAAGTAHDVAGNSARAVVAHINVDMTAPVVTYTGNAGTYAVDQMIAITCTATDALSGVASDTCSDITGAAWSFGLGTTSRSARAIDRAGNTGSGSTSFTVIVTEASLDNLIRRFFGSNQSAANGLIAKVHSLVTAPNANAKSGKLGAFDNQVDAKTGNPLTAAQAALLKQLAAAL